jgi:hypothetical protein
MNRWFYIFGVVVIIGLATFFAVRAGVAARDRYRMNQAEMQLKAATEAYNAKMSALEADIRQREARIAEVEGRLTASEAAVAASDRALAGARNITVKVQNDYKTTRSAPTVPTDLSVETLCAKLTSLGYACKPL